MLIKSKLRGLFKKGDDTSFLCSLISIFLALMFCIGRTGFDQNSVKDIYPFIGISFFILFLPDFVWRTFPNKLFSHERLWYGSYAIIFLIGLISVTAIGFLSPSLPFNPLSILIFAVSVFFILNLGSLILNPDQRPSIFKVLLVFVFSMWIAGNLWGRVYGHPLFIERLMVGGGRIGADTLAMSAFSHILKTYNIASTGLDGLPYYSYHFGSVWIFAQFSNLLKVIPLRFYQLGYPVIFIPLLFQSLFILSRTVRELSSKNLFHDVKNSVWEWLFLAIIFAGILPTRIIKLVYSENFMLVSESYVVGVTFSFIFVSITLAFFRSWNEKNRLKPWNLFFLYLLVPCFIGILGWMKLPLMGLDNMKRR